MHCNVLNMIHGILYTKRIELLLDALEHERFLRRPLVAELVFELRIEGREYAQGQWEAFWAAQRLLARLNTSIGEAEYKSSIARLVELTRGALEVDVPPLRPTGTDGGA